jgi:hypothetical protein
LASSVCRVIRLALDVATLFHLCSLIRQSVSDILAFLHHPNELRVFIFFSFFFNIFFFLHQQLVMGWLLCSRLIQFLPEEENKIISAFAGCESEYLTV